jgi:hypothetical protein
VIPKTVAYLAKEILQKMAARDNLRRFYLDRNVRVRGIEPRSIAWEAIVLPLNYTRERGSECRRSCLYSTREKRDYEYIPATAR